MVLDLAAVAKGSFPVGLLLGETEELALACGEAVQSSGALKSAGLMDGLGVVRVKGVQSLGVRLSGLEPVLLLHKRDWVRALAQFGEALNLFGPIVEVPLVVPQLVKLRAIQGFLRPSLVETVVFQQNKGTFDRRNKQIGRLLRLNFVWFSCHGPVEFVFGSYVGSE